LRLAVDTVEYCTRNMPKFYATYIDGYNLREYGLSAPQELAWTFSQGIAYIDAILERGLDIDEFGPRITFFMTSHKDFFEEIAKFRAARRMWAKIMKERYGAKDPRSMQFRFAVETAGSSLTSQQPLNNIIRITYQVIAAMLGGVQSMSPPSYLEAVSLPTEESARLQVRTQQILTYETGIPNVSDPLGGSYYMESLTNKLEEESNKILKEIEDRGGLVEAAKSGWVDEMIDKVVLQRQREVENNQRIVVGVNAFTVDESETPGGYFKNPAHEHELARGKEVVARVKRLKETRDNKKVKEALDRLQVKAKERKANLIPLMIEAAKAYATQGEIMGTIRQAYGLGYDPFGDIESPF
jgi:methylmalonyl-CoA mutase N-terminal domain/subunit